MRRGPSTAPAVCVAMGAALCVAAALAGCGAPSQVVLGFATDLSAPNVIDHVQMHVFSPQGAELLSQEWILPGIRAKNFKLPGSFTLFADNAGEPSVRVVLTGSLGADPTPIVTRTSTMQFAPEDTLFFRMTLVQRCMGVVCQNGESCIEGVCKNETVNTVSLREYRAGREEAIECDSGSHFIDTSTQEAMTVDGSGFCDVGEWCGESTCYRNQGQGLLWCTAASTTCGGVDDYESCVVAACEPELASCFGADWRRGRFAGPCRDFARCVSACDCDGACMASCAADRTAECATCAAAADACRTDADSACEAPTCAVIGSPDGDMATSPDADGNMAGPPPDMLPDMTVVLGKPAIAAGVYTVGCSAGDIGVTCNSDAMPPHQVQVGSYHIDQTEVTQAEYDACVTAGMCTMPVSQGYMPATTPTLPVAGVTNAQAMMFCAYRGATLGVQGRLPTEAEWEIAAHGVAGSTSEGTLYPWGDTDPLLDCVRALYIGCDHIAPDAVGTHPTGATASGIEDLGGNIAEWTSDFYDPMIYTIEAAMGIVLNPTGAPTDTGVKVIRGGSYSDSSVALQAATRGTAPPTTQTDQIGFRCVYIP